MVRIAFIKAAGRRAASAPGSPSKQPACLKGHGFKTMGDHLVFDLLIILGAGLVAAVICRVLRISMLVGYLVVGLLIGDGVLGLVSEHRHDVEKIAEAGVFMLLFAIGLEFSLKELWHLGRLVLIGGGIQMICVAAPVTTLLVVMGMKPVAATLIGLAVSFSSTVLVFKTLSEWGHTSRPHGRRAIGILLFQDAALIPLLLTIPLLSGASDSVSFENIATLATVSVAFVVSIVALRFVISRCLIPAFVNLRSAELVVLFTLVALAGITLVSHRIGLPPAIGAFAAGLVFSGSRLSHQVDALLLPFRETFAAVFFVSLGLMFDPRVLIDVPWLMAGSFLLLVAIKAAAATSALKLTGLSLRQSTAMGTGLAHIGEFAFVLLAIGWQAGVIEEIHYQRLVALAILSLVLTPFLLSTVLKQIGEETAACEIPEQTARPSSANSSAVVIGAGPVGRHLAMTMAKSGYDVCVIDYSPLNLQPFAQDGFRTVAGDATERDTLERADAAGAKKIVICVPEDQTAALIVKQVREYGSAIQLVVRCRYQSNVQPLKLAGADAVVSEETEVGRKILDSVIPTMVRPS